MTAMTGEGFDYRKEQLANLIVNGVLKIGEGCKVDKDNLNIIMTFVEESKNPKATSIILRGSTKLVDLRAAHDESNRWIIIIIQ
jgi:chaperonin GroEL (HSP60 family)